MFDTALRRLDDLPLLPELRQALQHLLAHDGHSLAGQHHWTQIIPAVQQALGGVPDTIAPFTTGWCLMYAAIRRLDALQDDDPIDDPAFTCLAPHLQYHLIFSSYLLATYLLGDLVAAGIPERRILRLHRLWTESLLRMAGGQQRDLMLTGEAPQVEPLSTYQAIAQCKTGATFGLAFGGVALLNNDDASLITALTLVGEIYGTLLQYSDDLLDDDAQPNRTLTLPEAFRMTLPERIRQHAEVQRAFWGYIYQAYYDQVVHALRAVSPTIREDILELFHATFGTPVTRYLSTNAD